MPRNITLDEARRRADANRAGVRGDSRRGAPPAWQTSYGSPGTTTSLPDTYINPITGQSEWDRGEGRRPAGAFSPQEYRSLLATPAPSWWPLGPAEWKAFLRRTPPGEITGLLATGAGQIAASDRYNENQQEAADILGQAGQDYFTSAEQRLGTAAGGIDQAAAAYGQSVNNAVSGYQQSPTAINLQKMTDPNYKAMTDEFVAIQRQEAARSIARGQANASAAAVAQASGRNPGGALAAQGRMAAGFRGAADRSRVNAQLASDQLTFNEDTRRRALEAMSGREGTALEAQLRGAGGVADMARAAAQYRGTVLPADPFATTRAAYIAGQDIPAFDFSAWPSTARIGSAEDAFADLNRNAQSIRDEMAAILKDERGRSLSEAQRQAAEEFVSGARDVVSFMFALLGAFPGLTV